MNCANCDRPLTGMEIGLTKKLINRGTTTCYCLTCLAARFRVSEDRLREMAENFKRMGCTLFQ